MQDLFDILKDYGLDNRSQIAQRWRRMGRASVASLSRELIQYGEDRRGRASAAGFAVAPVGGSMGLGSAEEVAWEAALLADHLILKNDLSTEAKVNENLASGGSAKEFERNRNLLLERLYPFLYQYLTLRPLWQRGMASFGYSDSLTDETDLPDEIFRAFLQHTELSVTGNGTPWFKLTSGSMSYLVTPDMSFGKIDIITDNLFKSVRDRIQTASPTVMFADAQGTTRVVDSELLVDTSHPLHSSFEQIVRDETSRIRGEVDLALASHAHYMTNRPLDLAVIAAGAEGTLSTPTPAISTFELAAELGFVRDVSLEQLVELRERLAPQFELARAALMDLSASLHSSDPASRQIEARQVVAQEIEPALARISSEVKAATRDMVRTGVAATGTAALSVLIAWLSWDPKALSGLMSVPFLKRILDGRARVDALRSEPMFFLHQVRSRAAK